MEPKISFTWPLFAVGIVGVALVSVVGLAGKVSGSERTVLVGRATSNLFSGTSMKPDIFEEQARQGLPLRLKIQKIDVHASIEYVGLTREGAMDAPKKPEDVGWFNLGPRPGEIGSAVIAGHFGWKNGIPAAFDNLSKLRKGDKIYIESRLGTTTAVTTFVVRAVQTFGENEDASKVFSSSDGKAHLNLITCEGVWNKIKKSYSNRLVVFTDEEIR